MNGIQYSQFRSNYMRMRGFTLLEMIVTLAIMGVAMISVIKY